MSTGGLFTLMVNEGKQDKLLMATELLNRRLKEIRRSRCKDPRILDSTPTLADIERTHLLFLNAHFKPFVAVAFEYAKIGVQEGIANFGNEVTFSIPQYGDFIHDMVLNVRLSGLGAGVTSTQARYCEFLGHRLLKKSRFEVNGKNLDEYTSEVYNFHYQFLPDNKKIAWKRCVGQETPHTAYLTQNPLVDEYREVKQIVNGPQTPKVTHVPGPNIPDIEMFIPLLFWFNMDPRLSIPSVAIPYGQRFIKIQLAEAVDICGGIPTADFTAPIITSMELYINNIFVNPEIHDIFIKRIGFSLIRVHREETQLLNTSENEILLDKLKYPIETIYMGVRPTINEGSMENWHRYHLSLDTNIPYPVAIPNPGVPPPLNVLAFAPATYKEAVPVLDSLSIKTIGIELWRPTPAKFFNTYTPYTYGGYNVSSPEDIGAYMVPFNLYPGSYQPSGHINLSVTREFYISYTSSVLNSIVTGNLYVVAIAINFLIIQDGNAVLRYNV